MSENVKSVKRFFIGFLAGGAAGAAVVLLTTPKSGENLRKEIKQKSDEYFDEVDKFLSESKHSSVKVIEESRKNFATILRDIKLKPDTNYRGTENVFNDAKGKTIIEVFNSGKELVEKETERLTSSVKAGIETYKNEKNNKT